MSPLHGTIFNFANPKKSKSELKSAENIFFFSYSFLSSERKTHESMNEIS